MIEFLKKFKVWFIAFFLGGTILAAGLIIPERSKIPEHLKLKAPKEKILSNEVIQLKNCIEYKEIISATSTSQKECVTYEYKDVVRYDYISEVEVPQATYEGLTEDISKRTKKAKFFPMGGKTVMTVTPGEPYEKVDGKWYQTETAITTSEVFNVAMGYQTPLAWLFGRNAYADISTTTSHSSDGIVEKEGGTWADIQDDTTGSADPWGTEYLQLSNHVNPIIARVSIPFDTSGVSGTVTKVQLKLFGNDNGVKYDNNGDSIVTVIHTRASDTTLADGDYDITSFGATELADRFDFGSYNQTLGALNEIVFNNDGKTSINQSGYTVIGLVASGDYDTTGAPDTSSINGLPSETAGTATDPTLVVTYLAGPTDTCTISTTGRHAMDLQDHCTTTVSTYSDYGMECYNQSGGSWVIANGVEVRVGSSTNCIPQIESTGVFSIQPIH